MNCESLSLAVEHQYRAALAMLRRAVVSCPDAVWDLRDGEAPFWQQAVHTAYYTHLYLLESDEAPPALAAAEQAMRLLGHPMTDWSGPEVQRLGRSLCGLTDIEAKPPRVVERAELLAMLDRCDNALSSAAARLAAGGALAPHPMSWMTGTALDLLLYNLRHLQHHTGRLHSLLGRHGVLRLAWEGGMPAKAE